MYRAFVDHELFAERTWLWPDQDLEETWQLAHRPGRYHLHYELIGTGRLVIGNWQVLAGTASINKHGHLAIHNS